VTQENRGDGPHPEASEPGGCPVPSGSIGPRRAASGWLTIGNSAVRHRPQIRRIRRPSSAARRFGSGLPINPTSVTAPRSRAAPAPPGDASAWKAPLRRPRLLHHERLVGSHRLASFHTQTEVVRLRGQAGTEALDVDRRPRLWPKSDERRGDPRQPASPCFPPSCLAKDAEFRVDFGRDVRRRGGTAGLWERRDADTGEAVDDL
jgi:hypothetical protein